MVDLPDRHLVEAFVLACVGAPAALLKGVGHIFRHDYRRGVGLIAAGAFLIYAAVLMLHYEQDVREFLHFIIHGNAP